MTSDVNLPTWIRAAAQLGVPSLIALGLVYWLAVRMDASQARIERMLQIQTAFEYATCFNMATNELGTARCAIALDGALEERKVK